MDKTVSVAVTDRVRHGRYDKTVQRTTKVFAHDEQNDLKVGDRVRLQETRPLSKQKRWRVVEVIERVRGSSRNPDSAWPTAPARRRGAASRCSAAPNAASG